MGWGGRKQFLKGDEEKMKRTKRLLRIALILGLVIGLTIVPATSVYAADAISITLPGAVGGDATMSPGTTFSMNVEIDSITDFDSMNYDVVATPDGVVNLTSVSNGDIGGTAIPVITPNPTNQGTPGVSDWWRVVANVPGFPGVTGSGYFAVLNFTVVGSATDTVVITLANGIVSDNTANAIPCTWTGTGTLTIAAFEVTDIGVVGDVTTTEEGYINPGDATDQTTFTLTPTIVGGNGAFTYAWTFGIDGTGSTTTAAPSDVVYSSAGAKTIALTVTDALGSTSSPAAGMTGGTATIYDTLNFASFSGTSGNAGNEQEGIIKWTGAAWETTTNYSSSVAFSAVVSDGKVPYTYAWDFNTGDPAQSTSAVAAPSFDYANATTGGGVALDVNFEGAQYTVSLLVDDALTADDTQALTTYISIYVAGDINGPLGVGGQAFVLEAGDITEIELIIALVNTQTFASDANDDGNVNALDITKTELLVT